MEKTIKQDLKRLFYPESVAVFGSVKKNKIGNQIIYQMVGGGCRGRIFSINPKGERPEGFPSITGFSDINKVKETVDLAVVSVPVNYVCDVLESCGLKKVPFAVVLSSGFSEAGNIEDEEKLKEISKKYGIRLIGPNCAGIMNTSAGLFASIEVRALSGRTGFITQSGAVGGAVLAMAKERGIGFSKFVSYGNRVDIGEIELLQYLENDSETKVIAIYLESVENGHEFLRVAQKLLKKKPFIIIKSGKSKAGVRAAGSHTGSMAGSDDVFDAAVKRTGAIRVSGIEEMLDLCDGFTHLPALTGKRIAIVTNSGGPGILTSDRAEELGLDIREPGVKLKNELKNFLAGHCSLNNPFDLTVEGTKENFYKTIKAALEKGYDGAIAINVATPFLDSESLAEGIIDAAGELKDKKPVASVFMAGEIVGKSLILLKESGIPVFPTGERAAYVFSKLFDFYSRGKKDQREWKGKVSDLPLSGPVLEPDAITFLSNKGFAFPRFSYIVSSNELQDAASNIGFPLVMKVVSPQIIHKSDSGGVILNIKSIDQLKDEFVRMKKKFFDFDFRGAMLCEQIENHVEIIIGMKRDPQFGPVLLVGAGGVLTELVKDTSLRVAPVDRDEALEMISELGINKLISGFRGKPKLDREALAKLVSKVSVLPLEYPSINELDLNPVFVTEKGLFIGDVRIIV